MCTAWGGVGWGGGIKIKMPVSSLILLLTFVLTGAILRITGANRLGATVYCFSDQCTFIKMQSENFPLATFSYTICE